MKDKDCGNKDFTCITHSVRPEASKPRQDQTGQASRTGGHDMRFHGDIKTNMITPKATRY